MSQWNDPVEGASEMSLWDFKFFAFSFWFLVFGFQFSVFSFLMGQCDELVGLSSGMSQWNRPVGF